MVKDIYIYSIEEQKKILKSKSKPVTIDEKESIKEVIQNLKDTLHAHEDGRGISAVQIGVLKTVCYITWGGKEIVMINPKITRTRGEKEFVEGCLSAPTILKKVKRAQKVWCTYLDENWEEQEIAEGGRMSNIIQHELDHFEGKCKVAEEN